MPEIASAQLGTILDRHMREKNFSNQFLAEYLELSALTISKFRKNKSNPHRETLDKVENWLKEEGALSRLNIPTDLGPLADQPPAEPDETDREQLADMGILPGKPLMKSDQKHYVCAYLDSWDFAQVIHSLMDSPMPEADKKRLLGQLFTQDFPSLAVE